MKRRIWCALWGHSLEPRPAIHLPLGHYVDCTRCGRFFGYLPAHERMPLEWVRRPIANYGAGCVVTLGPLRRFTEYLSCHYLGHDEQWLSAETRFGDYATCMTCGQRGAFRYTYDDVYQYEREGSNPLLARSR